MMESSGRRYLVFCIHSDQVENEKSNSFYFSFWSVITYHILKLVCTLASYVATSRSYIWGSYSMDEYHPICIHRALDASPMLLTLMFIKAAVCMSTKLFKLCC